MGSRTAMTVHRSREEVRRLWESSDHRPEFVDGMDAVVTFRDAPGDRGTEIHVELEGARGGRLGGAVRRLRGPGPLAKVKDELRHFKQLLETGELARSDAAPEGERAERKLKQRAAQPLEGPELEKAGG